jgi:acetyltransferase-like isoleucine patch superfamily enzyme
VALYGSGGIIMEDYTGVSPQSAIFSAMDDFSGEYLIGPIHPNNLTNVNKGCVVLKKFSQIGTHCVVFPNVTIGEGSVLGAMTLANRNIPEWGIYIGQPARLLRRRSKGLLDLLKKREN